jgi:multiple sugar transport system substrate-binding protein
MGKFKLGYGLGVLAAAILVLGGCAKVDSAKSKVNHPVTITYWHRMTGSWNQAQQHMIEAFNASQSKYKVVAQSMGSYDALQQKLMAAAKSKTLPTMAQAPNTNIGDYAKTGLITPFIFPQKTLTQVYPSFLTGGQYQGKQYGMPYSVSTQVMFVNTDLVKQYHLTIPKTWNDVEKMGPALAKSGVATIALDASYDVALESMAHEAGSPLITPAQKANLDNPKTLAQVDRLLALRKAGILSTAGSDGYFSTAFFNKKAVFGIASSASIPVIQDQAPKSLHWTTTQIPSVNGSSQGVLNGNYNVVFKSASKTERVGAAAFQKFLLKPKQAAYWAEKSGYVPVTPAAVQSDDYQSFLADHAGFKASVKASEDSFASTVFAGYGDYRNALLDTVDSTLTKNVSGDTAFKALQTKTEKILAEN